MPETAKRTARVPILGEDGRISDDYIPAAIGEGVESAEAAATRAETAATSAEGSATAAGQSAAGAQGSASAAGASATQAQQSAAAASGAATRAQSAQQAAEAAKTGAESARDSAQTAASQAQQSAASVADKFIASAQATTLEPGSQATASVADQVLTIGVPKGDKGDTGDTGDQGVQGEKGEPGTAATIAVGSVTGLAAGASPTVVNSGTANAAVLDFGIPKGDKGDKGEPGQDGQDATLPEGMVTADDIGVLSRLGSGGEPSIMTGVVVGNTANSTSATMSTWGNSPNVSILNSQTKAGVSFGLVDGEPVLSAGKSQSDQKVYGFSPTIPEDDALTIVTSDAYKADTDPLKQRISELEQQTQNVVTGTSIDLVAHGEDAFAQKPIEVRVKGKTWVNRWMNPATQTINGITLTNNEDGSVTVSGTAEKDAYIATVRQLNIRQRNTYTLSVDKMVAGAMGFYVNIWSGGNQTPYYVGGSRGNYLTKTFTTSASFDYVQFGFGVTAGSTVSGTYRVMLVDGTEAPDCFTPPASIASVETGKLVTNGKNLLPETPSAFSTSTAGITFARNDDGSIHIEGTGTSMYPQAPIFNELHFPPGITVSAGSTTMGMAPNAYIVLYGVAGDGNTQISTSKTGSSRSGTTDGKFEHYLLIVVAEGEGTSYDGDIYFWLELGSTATAYEPPTVTQTPLPDVELRSLPNGTCDELVIAQDGTATVERRTQLVDGEVVALDTPATEPQSPVTLPALPAPTFNQYHDADVPSDTSTEYVRDINIVLDNLAKQVAGMASAVAVREASTIEEE